MILPQCCFGCGRPREQIKKFTEHHYGGPVNTESYFEKVCLICEQCNSIEPKIRKRLGRDIPLTPEEIYYHLRVKKTVIATWL